MNNIKRKVSILCLVAAMCVSISRIAYAWSPGTYVDIRKSGKSLKFKAEVTTDAPADHVDYISLTTESIDEGTGRAISFYDWNTSGRRKIASGYTLTRPYATAYSKWAHGIINLIPQYPYDNYEETVNTYYNNSRSVGKNKALIEERDAKIADSFEIDLSGYTTLDPFNEAYFEEGLLQTRRVIGVKPGDTVPVTYLSEDGSHAYVMKQDPLGVNHICEFEKVGDEWTLISSDEKQGTKMEFPSIPSDVIEGGIEEELDISLEDFFAE